MKLDKNTNYAQQGKYALVKLRELADADKWTKEIFEAVELLSENGIIDYGDNPFTEFFVIRLKDKFAGPALTAYGLSAINDDPEWSLEILRLAEKAANHAQKRMPD